MRTIFIKKYSNSDLSVGFWLAAKISEAGTQKTS
jgi:hypothetical protein